MDGNWFTAAATYLPGGLGAGAGAAASFWFIRWLIEWFTGRFDKTTERLDGRMERLIDRLEREISNLTKRLEHVEVELEECKKLHAQERAARLGLEAMVQGRGDARQTAALIVASEKAKDRDARERE